MNIQCCWKACAIRVAIVSPIGLYGDTGDGNASIQTRPAWLQIEQYLSLALHWPFILNRKLAVTGYVAEQEVHWLELASAADPAGHGVQAAAPCAAYVLTGQVAQLAELPGAAVPAAQGWQLADPPGEAVPAVQGWQPLATHVEGSLPAGQSVLAPVQPVERC